MFFLEFLESHTLILQSSIIIKQDLLPTIVVVTQVIILNIVERNNTAVIVSLKTIVTLHSYLRYHIVSEL